MLKSTNYLEGYIFQKNWHILVAVLFKTNGSIMNLTDLTSQNYAYFPIYVEADRNNFRLCPSIGSFMPRMNRKKVESMGLQEFTYLKTKFEEDVERIYVLSHALIEYSRDLEVVSSALREIRSSAVNPPMGSFVSRYLHNFFHPLNYAKLVFLINSGEAVNQAMDLEHKKTPLQILLESSHHGS